MTASYSTFGNELQPLLVMAGIQPGKDFDLAERVKNQGRTKEDLTKSLVTNTQGRARSFAIAYNPPPFVFMIYVYEERV